MTRPTTTGKAQDLITFTRSTTGTALAKISYGEELVTNGDFSSGSTGWALSNWTWNNGSLSITNLTGSITQAVTPLVTGKTYTVLLEVSELTQGNWYLWVNGAYVIGASTEAGAIKYSWTQSSADKNVKIVCGVASTLTVDNISIKEVLYDQPDGTLQLFNHPINKPRIEYDASGNCLGLLVEEGRTNNLIYSNQASQLGYHGDGVTTGVDTTEVSSPEGSGTVIKLNKTAGGYGFARVSYGSVTYAQTLSAFVKKGTARYIGFRQLADVATHTTFDLETNTWVQTSGSTSRGYEDYGNGWLRLWVVSDDSDSKVWASLCIANSGGAENNSETGTVYVYGIQRETGLFPTSYIPTSGSAVTRVVDSAVATLSDFYYRQKNGSMVVEFTSKYDESAGLVKRVCEIGNTVTSDNRIMTYVKTDETRLSSQVWDNDDNEFSKTLTTSVPNGTGVYSKVALAWETNNAHAALDGDLVGSADTDVSLTQTRDTLGIMRSTTGTTNSLTGHIKSIQYYPLRVADAKLETLTS